MRGFNLLLVLAALLLGALLTQWRWSRNSIATVTVQRRLPGETVAGSSFSVRYRLSNHNRFMTAWMLRLEDKIESVSGTEQVTAGCAIASVRPRQVASADYDCVIADRGRYRFGPIQLETTFPFSLFRCRKTIADEDQICVFPKPLTLRRHWQQRLISREGGTATTARRMGANEGDFFGLREWQHGDSPKWIHWRTTARLLEPAVRQFEQQRRFNLCIVVDAYAESELDTRDAEIAIRLAATFATKLIVAPANRIVLGAAGVDHGAEIGVGLGPARRQMLNLFADIRVSRQPKLVETINRAFEIAGPIQDLIVVSSRSQTEAIEGTIAQRNLHSTLTSQCRMQWIDVRGDNLDEWVVGESR